MSYQAEIQHGAISGAGLRKPSLRAALEDAFNAWVRTIGRHPSEFKPNTVKDVRIRVWSSGHSVELLAIAHIRPGERKVTITVPGKIAPRSTYDITNVALAVQDFKYQRDGSTLGGRR